MGGLRRGDTILLSMEPHPHKFVSVIYHFMSTAPWYTPRALAHETGKLISLPICSTSALTTIPNVQITGSQADNLLSS